MIHPQFDPVAISFTESFQIHWYGLMYLFAFATAYALASFRAKKIDGWTGEMISDLLFYGSLGVIFGGRIGYVLFYQFDSFLQNPMYLLKVNEGGMSFHGGFIGVMLGMWYFGRRYKKSAFTVLDFIAPCVPIGLFFGRFGNYINGELWGRVTSATNSWITYFPQARFADAELLAADPALESIAKSINGSLVLPRHPSQMYEAIAEGILLFILLWWFSSKPRPRMAISALFLLGYGLSRFVIEFFRQPDADQGFVLLGWMTKGQMLTAPMIIAGIIMLVVAYRRGIFDWKTV